MGQWTITIQGTGPHHNADYGNDADKMAEYFVALLRSAGHTVGIAHFTYGGREELGLARTARTEVHLESGTTATVESPPLVGTGDPND